MQKYNFFVIGLFSHIFKAAFFLPTWFFIQFSAHDVLSILHKPGSVVDTEETATCKRDLLPAPLRLTV